MNHSALRKSSSQEHPLLELERGLLEDQGDDDASADLDSSQGPLEELVQKDSSSCSKHYVLYQGLLFSSGSSLFFSLCSVIVKHLKYIHPGQLACFRFLGILVFTTPLVIYGKHKPFGPSNLRHLLIFRGVVGATSLFLRFCAIHYLPIADASVIIFSVPVFVSAMAKFFLKESCGFFHVFAVLLTLIGLGLITKLPLIFGGESSQEFTSQGHIWGVLAALSSTIFGASVYIVVRKVKGVHHAVIMFNFGWVAIIETTLITAIIGTFGMPRCGLDQWLIIVLGFFSFAGQILLTRALQLEQAGPVSVVRSAADIAFVYMWQILFFDEVPDKYSISGALLVTICVLLTGVRKWALSLPEESPARKKLFFLTI